MAALELEMIDLFPVGHRLARQRRLPLAPFDSRGHQDDRRRARRARAGRPATAGDARRPRLRALPWSSARSTTAPVASSVDCAGGEEPDCNAASISSALAQLERKRRGPGSELDDFEVLPARVLPSPKKPMEVARILAAREYTSAAASSSSRHHRGEWWRYQGPKWVEVPRRVIRAEVYRLCERPSTRSRSRTARSWCPGPRTGPRSPTCSRRSPPSRRSTTAPARRRGSTGARRRHRRLRQRPARRQRPRLCRHTPLFFNSVSVPFAYDPDAPEPARWLAFLEELWATTDPSGPWPSGSAT